MLSGAGDNGLDLFATFHKSVLRITSLRAALETPSRLWLSDSGKPSTKSVVDSAGGVGCREALKA